MYRAIIGIILLFTNTTFAVPDSSLTFIIKDFRITSLGNNNDSLAKGKEVLHKNLIKAVLYSDTLVVTSEDKIEYYLTLNSIKKVHVRDGSFVLTGMGIGAASGFALGFLLGTFAAGDGSNSGHPSFSSDERFGLAGGVILGLTFGILGTVFGALTPNYEDFDLRKYNDFEKKRELIKIFEKYNK